ncbi:hypothetical protein CCR75_005737 [Bremia lactucae]|uniref:RanBP2-type domain-containing protein n=1 Tax=Bremia lactucae TaxID=4779 RepID=A0A976FRA9_BRELC|nr:hypothetical protein CCR75_005737 [Bremia lactucae]
MVAAFSTASHSAQGPTRASSRASTASTASVRRRPRSYGPLKGVVAMVDVRVGSDAQIDCSDVVARKLRELGASTVKRFTSKLTHMVLSQYTPAYKSKIYKWQARGNSMAVAATRYELKIVSQLWVNACYVAKKRMDERPFFPIAQQNLLDCGSQSVTLPPKRRQSLGAEALQLSTTTLLTTVADKAIKEVSTASKLPLKALKGLHRGRRKRALSMEPMTSDAILKMLGTTVDVASYSTPTKQIRGSKGTSSSAKRRKTLNGPLTQQDVDEVTASQASGIVCESDYENQVSKVVKEDDVVQECQAIREVSVANMLEPLCLANSIYRIGMNSETKKLKTLDENAMKGLTARELRRRNRNSLSYGSGLTLKSGIWSCGTCGCSNPRSSLNCSDCRVERNVTKSPREESMALSTSLKSSEIKVSVSLPVDASSGSTLTTEMMTPTKKASTVAAQDTVKSITSPAVLALTRHSLSRPTVSSAAKSRGPHSTASKSIQPVLKSRTRCSENRSKSPVPCSVVSTQPIRNSLASASVLLDTTNAPKGSMSLSSVSKPIPSRRKKRAFSLVDKHLTTPDVKVMRRDQKDVKMDTTFIATPGSVSGFMRKHREVDSTPIPMAMPFSSASSRKTPQKSPRNVFGITGVTAETRGVLQCAIHAIDANMANDLGHRKARVVKSVDYAAGVTHLIVGRDTKRTIKVLFAIARGAWIVTEDWAFSSLEQERWLPEEQFELTIFANKFSRQHPESRHIFKGIKFFVGPTVEPSRDVLQSLIQVAGGELCHQISVADMCICGDASLYRRAQRTGIRVVMAKWIFDSIATMKLQDDADYSFLEALDTLAKTPLKRRGVESFGTPAVTPAKHRTAMTLGLEAHSTVPEN